MPMMIDSDAEPVKASETTRQPFFRALLIYAATRQLRRCWAAGAEPSRVVGVGGVEGAGALGSDLRGVP